MQHALFARTAILRGALTLLALAIPLLATVSPVYAQATGTTGTARTRFKYQSPSEYYLLMRRTYPPRPGVTPGDLMEDPGAVQGSTLELEGRLSGVVRSEDGGAYLILATEDSGSLTLKMSLLPDWIQPGVRLRTLAVPIPASEDEVHIGMPDLLVVAVASASDIGAAEQKARQEAAARQERSRQRQAALNAARTQLARTAAPGNPTDYRATAASRKGTRKLAPRPVNSSAVLGGLSPEARAVLPRYQGFIQQWNRRLSEAEAQVIAASVLLYCEEYDVDPRLMMALLIAESDFRPETTSHKGAMGLGQLMPDEVKQLGLSNPYDPVQNIYGAVYLLRGRLDKYSQGASRENLQMQHIILALASYNAGMGAVKKYGGVPPYRETRNYVKKIERIYRQLCGEEG